MSVLQERLMLVLGDVGRVAVTEKALLNRLQERWPTEHGYAAQIVHEALESLRQGGSIHRSAAGRWTKFLNMSRTETPPTPAPAASPATDQIKGPAAADTTQENEVAEKAKCCTKCGKDKPIGEFYAKNTQCKRCVLDRQRELKAEKAGGKSTAAPANHPAIKNLKAKAAGKQPAQHNGSIVAISFALHIEDMHGVFHDISVSKPVVQRLITELREYA